jgi:hypothetical protein
MKVELRQIVESVPAINELASKPMKAKTAYHISKILNEINKHLKPYSDVRTKLVEKYEADASGPVLVFSDNKEEDFEKRKKFDEELAPVLDEKVVLKNVNKISVIKLGNIQISPGALATIDWLLED